MPAGTAIPFGRYFASRHRAVINDESWLQVTHNWVTKRTLGNNYTAITDEMPSYTIANSSRIGKLFT